jgi:hypothetical protein
MHQDRSHFKLAVVCKWLVESALTHPHALNYMKGCRPKTLTANRGRPRRVGDSMQRLAMDVSGVVAFIRVTEAAKF